MNQSCHTITTALYTHNDYIPVWYHVIAEETARQQWQFGFFGSRFESTHEALVQQCVHRVYKH